MGKKDGSALVGYMKKLRKEIENYLVPWVEEEKIERYRKRLKSPPKSAVYDASGKPIDLSDKEWWKAIK